MDWPKTAISKGTSPRSSRQGRSDIYAGTIYQYEFQNYIKMTTGNKDASATETKVLRGVS